MNELEIITNIINQYFGVDAAYYGIDPVIFAQHLIDNNCRTEVAIEVSKELIEKYYSKDKAFEFEYGIIKFKHRFSINRSLWDYQETTLTKCIRVGIQYKYTTMAKDKLIAEMQIIYKDDNDKLKILRKDLQEWTFTIVNKGNMSIQI